jgi:hypothetical protein
MLCEIQVVFSPDSLAPNSHMNHLLYEVKRCSNLETLSKAIHGIAIKSKGECVSLKTFAPISANAAKLDTLY